MFNVFNWYAEKGPFITNTVDISTNSCIYRITSVNHCVNTSFTLLEIIYLYGNVQTLCQDIQWGLSHFDLHGWLDPTLKEFLIKLLFTKGWGFCKVVLIIFISENLVNIIMPLGIALITLLNSFSFTKYTIYNIFCNKIRVSL